MTEHKGIKILFIAGFGPITQDQAASKKLYQSALGIDFEEMENGYVHTDKVAGVKHFALWPLEQAAESCFGVKQWPSDLPVPHAWIEFDVEDVAAATEALTQQGYTFLVSNRTEPWGQTVSRFLDPDGTLVGFTFTPWMRTH
ncbi:MAG: glyoxalase [Parcubacteria group bacterium RIFOXYD2_FULL_52_8]|nr:MAG: glyoxalase [Parcubacteria group bacterium RIFOXYD2_FULL_52_8]